MKREVYEKQKTFAGEKKPSMQRRLVGHDYSVRQMYMVTLLAPWAHHNELARHQPSAVLGAERAGPPHL